jgi:Shedu protein SduA, C-terminal
LEDRISALAALKKSFIALLDKQSLEQEYQEFIEKNTALVPREFIQNHGVHLDVVFRKLSLAADYTTDFFYLSKSSADWNCVLIEIEKPQSKYFKDDTSTDFHPDFHAAYEQINRWRAWFANESNRNGFINGTISLVRAPEHWMWQNPCYIKFVLVHGRRAEFAGNEIRRRIIKGLETDEFHILSYDSLVESLHSKGELYVARRKNEHIEVLSEGYVSEGLLTSVDPSYLKITDELR